MPIDPKDLSSMQRELGIGVTRIGPSPVEPTPEQTAQVHGVDDPPHAPDPDFGRSIIANTEAMIAQKGITGTVADNLRKNARKSAEMMGYVSPK